MVALGLMRTDAWQVERDFVPENIREAAVLRRAVIDAGYPPKTANGLVGWLLGRAVEDQDGTSNSTRSAYRRVLEGLPGGPRKPGERPIMYRRSVTSSRRREAARAALSACPRPISSHKWPRPPGPHRPKPGSYRP